MSQLKRNSRPIGAYAVPQHTHNIIKESRPDVNTILSEKEFKKYKTRKALKHLATIETRDALKPYKGQRLGFEAVLIQVNPPNKKNGHTYGLVFASVYAPDRSIELDHVVIQAHITAYEGAELELFQRYYFTAEVGTYIKTINLLGIPAQQENYMLYKMNLKKITHIETSQLSQPTEYIKTRVNNIVLCKTREPEHTESELYDMIAVCPNDGSKERFVEEYSKTYQAKKMSSLDVINALYKMEQ